MAAPGINQRPAGRGQGARLTLPHRSGYNLAAALLSMLLAWLCVHASAHSTSAHGLLGSSSALGVPVSQLPASRSPPAAPPLRGPEGASQTGTTMSAAAFAAAVDSNAEIYGTGSGRRRHGSSMSRGSGAAGHGDYHVDHPHHQAAAAREHGHYDNPRKRHSHADDRLGEDEEDELDRDDDDDDGDDGDGDADRGSEEDGDSDDDDEYHSYSHQPHHVSGRRRGGHQHRFANARSRSGSHGSDPARVHAAVADDWVDEALNHVPELPQEICALETAANLFVDLKALQLLHSHLPWYDLLMVLWCACSTAF